MKCKVKVIETLSRVIEVEAESESAAIEKVRKMQMILTMWSFIRVVANECLIRRGESSAVITN